MLRRVAAAGGVESVGVGVALPLPRIDVDFFEASVETPASDSEAASALRARVRDAVVSFEDGLDREGVGSSALIRAARPRLGDAGVFFVYSPHQPCECQNKTR